MTHLVTIALVLFAASGAGNAQEVEIRAASDSRVPLGTQGSAEIRIRGLPRDILPGALPVVSGLELTLAAPRLDSAGETGATAPAVGSATTTVFELRWRPFEIGRFDIPPLVFDRGGTELRTPPLTVEATPDPVGERNAFVEVALARETAFVGERVPLALRIGVDERFLAESALPLSSRASDVVVAVEAPGFRTLDGARVLPAKTSPSATRPRRLAVNDTIEAARDGGVELRDDRRFALFELWRDVVPERDGAIAIPAALLRLGYATRFEEDLLGNRLPLDGAQAFASAAGTTLEVRPLPTEGRPDDFSSAVGHFTIEADAEPRAVKAGDVMRLRLTIRGDGDLSRITPPHLRGLRGFRVLGRLDPGSELGRTFVYEIVPLGGDIREIPSIAFSYFDPTPPGAYAVARTHPIEVSVAGPPSGLVLGTENRDGEPECPRTSPLASEGATPPSRLAPLLPIPAEGDREPAAALSRTGAGALLALPWLLALVAFLRLRIRDRDRVDPLGARARRAARAFRRALREPATPAAHALAEYLGSRLGTPAAAAIAPELATRLAAAGIPPEDALDATRTLFALVAERYGGPSAAAAKSEAATLVSRLESAFRTRERRR